MDYSFHVIVRSISKNYVWVHHHELTHLLEMSTRMRSNDRHSRGNG